MIKIILLFAGIMPLCFASDTPKYPPLPKPPSASLPLPPTPPEKKATKKEGKKSAPPLPPIPRAAKPPLPVSPKTWESLVTAINTGKLNEVQDIVPAKIQLYSVSSKGQTPLEMAQKKAQLLEKEGKTDAAINVTKIVDYLNMLVESESFPAPKKERRKSKIETQFGDTHQVPGDLRNKVIYIQSVQQPKDACGYHAIINTWAVQNTLSEKEELTSETINTKFLEKETGKSIVCTKESEITELMKFSEQNFPDLNNIFFIRYDTKSNTIVPAGAYNITDAKDFDDYVEQLRYNTRAQGYFIANINGHWVLMAVLTVQDKKLIVYINSLNSPLTKEYFGYRILKELGRLTGIE